jgi:hypothetical protein
LTSAAQKPEKPITDTSIIIADIVRVNLSTNEQNAIQLPNMPIVRTKGDATKTVFKVVMKVPVMFFPDNKLKTGKIKNGTSKKASFLPNEAIIIVNIKVVST